VDRNQERLAHLSYNHVGKCMIEAEKSTSALQTLSILCKEDDRHFGGTSKETLMGNDPWNQQISELSKK
jgi:hypothetical protein